MQHTVIVHHKHVPGFEVNGYGGCLPDQVAELEQDRVLAVPSMHEEGGIVEPPMTINLRKKRVFVGVIVEDLVRHEAHPGQVLTVGFR